MDLKRQLSRDAWNAFVVAELLKEWVQARQSVLAFPSRMDSLSVESELGSARAPAARGSGCERTWSSREAQVGFSIQVRGEEDRHLTRGSSTARCSPSDGSMPMLCMGETIDTSLTAGAVVDGVAVAGTRIADQLGKAAAAASQVLGIAGALISTGFAIRGWSTSKAGQLAVRERLAELSSRVLQIQQLLAGIDRLECPLCADYVILGDTVQRCVHGLHCFHAACFRQWQQRFVPQGRGLSVEMTLGCPECPGPMEYETELLVESVELRQRRMRLAGRDIWHSCSQPTTGLGPTLLPAAGGGAGLEKGGGNSCRAAQEALMIPAAAGRRSRQKSAPQCGLAACFATC